MCCCTLKSLWCMSLRTAGMVIGWSSAVISLIESITYIVILVNVDKFVALFPTDDNRMNAAVLTGISALVSVQLGTSILNFAASVLVIIGTTKNSHLMLLPWLIHNGTIWLFILFLNFGVFLSLLKEYNAGIGFVIVSIVLVIFGLAWIVILSLFRNIRETKDANDRIAASNYEMSNNTENGTGTLP